MKKRTVCLICNTYFQADEDDWVCPECETHTATAYLATHMTDLLDFVEYVCVRFGPDQKEALSRGEELLRKYGRL